MFNWTAATAASSGAWLGVTYGGGRFVAVRASVSEGVMWSPDGNAWTRQTVPEANDWQSVIYGNNTYIAVSQTGSNRAMYSTDAINWTPVKLTISGWQAIAYGNGRFVITAIAGTTRVMYADSSFGAPFVDGMEIINDTEVPAKTVTYTPKTSEITAIKSYNANWEKPC